MRISGNAVMFQFFIWKLLDGTVSKVHYLFYSITWEVANLPWLVLLLPAHVHQLHLLPLL